MGVLSANDSSERVAKISGTRPYGLARDDVEYILSTFKGIHDEQTLFPGHVSTAARIVQKYAEMSFAG